MADIGKAYVQIIPKAEGISGKIGDLIKPGATAAGQKAGSDSGKGFGEGFKKMIAGLAIGTTVTAGLKAALDEGGKLQQSYGGLETIYGDAAAAAKQYAAEAAKAGISANSYAEQAVSFGAGLKQAFGGDTTKAVEAANVAIMDMADNAAKMGTPIESIQNAYQGFAKQNYTMLDNLKLGYGGTKSEMERLLADAQKISGVEYNIDNLGDVYDAIHVIQGELGLTGVAAEEASTTFSGAFGAMQAAGKNLLANLALGQDVGPAMTTFVQTVGTFLFNNLIPMLANIGKSIPQAIGTAITAAAPQIATAMPAMLEQGKNLLMTIASGVIASLPDLATTASQIITSISEFLQANLPTLGEKGGEMLGELAKNIITSIPTVVSAIGQLVPVIGNALLQLIPVAMNAISQMIAGLVSGIIAGAVAIAPAVMRLVNKITQPLRDAIAKGRQIMTDMMTAMSGVWDSIKTKAGSAFEAIKTKITKPIESAKSTVKGIIDKISGFFPLSVGRIFDNIKLPHFNISGGTAPWGIGGKGTKPTISVSWYARGGVFDSPSVIGVGEAGREAVIPLSGPNMKPFADAIAAAMPDGKSVNITNYFTINESSDAEDVANQVGMRIQQILRTA